MLIAGLKKYHTLSPFAEILYGDGKNKKLQKLRSMLLKVKDKKQLFKEIDKIAAQKFSNK